MLRVFVDTSVLFAAVYSRSGYAYDLMELTTKDQLRVVMSQAIPNEVERNIRKKAEDRMYAYHRYIDILEIELMPEPQADLAAQVASHVVAKDVHVIAAAIAARPDYLVTYDHKHLLDVPEVAARSGLKIVTPDIVMKLL
jgi:putative PIN family toxin of toxin-antitoxin system